MGSLADKPAAVSARLIERQTMLGDNFPLDWLRVLPVHLQMS